MNNDKPSEWASKQASYIDDVSILTKTDYSGIDDVSIVRTDYSRIPEYSYV